MGKKEIDELTAVADLLSDIIAFLLTYKTEIQQAYNRIQALREGSNQDVLGSDYLTLEEIKTAFEKLKGGSEKLPPIELLVKACPLLISADHLIEIRLRKCIENSLRRIRWCTYVMFENGINSVKNQVDTKLMILPRWITMWEGSGEDREIESESFNRFLKHSRHFNMTGAYVEKKYQVNCYYIDKIKAAHPDVFKQGENSLIIGMAPMFCDFNLKEKNSKEMDWFIPKPWTKPEKARIKKIIIDTINKAEEKRVNLLVFPEMLGYPKLKEEICIYLKGITLAYLKLIVLPSAWESLDNKGTNTSCLIQTSDGVEIFSQGKLIPFSDRHGRKTEALIPDDTMNLLFDEIHGCMGIMICRSALEKRVRDLVVNDFGVKLLIVPSWSPDGYAFKRALPSVADANCNIVWVNTCSALGNEKIGEKPVCMITQVCKVPGKENLEPIEFFPIKNCNKECTKGEACLFVARIGGVVCDG